MATITLPVTHLSKSLQVPLRKEDGVFIFLHGFGDSGRGFLAWLRAQAWLYKVRYSRLPHVLVQKRGSPPKSNPEAGCQTYGPFLRPYYNTAPII